MKLLGELREIAKSPRIQEISDSIEVLSRAYSTDGTSGRWDAFGFTLKERDLMDALEASRGRYVSRENLVDRMYGHLPPEKTPDPKIIDVLVVRVRRKLIGFGLSIKNLHAVGFMLEAKEAERSWEMWHGVPLPRNHFLMAKLLYGKLGQIVRYDEFPNALRDWSQGRVHWFRKRLSQTAFDIETVFGVGLRMVLRGAN